MGSSGKSGRVECRMCIWLPSASHSQRATRSMPVNRASFSSQRSTARSMPSVDAFAKKADSSRRKDRTQTPGDVGIGLRPFGWHAWRARDIIRGWSSAVKVGILGGVPPPGGLILNGTVLEKKRAAPALRGTEGPGQAVHSGVPVQDMAGIVSRSVWSLLIAIALLYPCESSFSAEAGPLVISVPRDSRGRPGTTRTAV